MSDGLVRFEQEAYTGGMAVAVDGEWVRFDAAEQWAADAVEAFRAVAIEAIETMPTARIISQWDLVSRRAVLALLDTP